MIPSRLVAYFLVALTGSIASAGIDLQYAIDNPVQYAGPNEIVSVLATLTNLPTADEAFLGSSVNGPGFSNGTLVQFPAGVGGPYTLSINIPNTQPKLGFAHKFIGLVLEPGESFGFELATLTPAPGPVAEGMYMMTNLSFSYSQGSQSGAVPAPTGFTIIVVPEPTSLALLGCGALWLAEPRRRRDCA